MLVLFLQYSVFGRWLLRLFAVALLTFVPDAVALLILTFRRLSDVSEISGEGEGRAG